jgi:uncharacterized protein
VSNRIQDTNGWFETRANPVSKVGVFEYMGYELPGAPDRNKRYKVYRPAEELGSAETLDSFRLVPIIDDHEMLGAKDQGLTPAEKKGAHGITGESVSFDGTYLRANLKIFSNALATKIANGKRELSAGYRCAYDWVSGVFDGQPYDVVQRAIRANHIALVARGRMGSEVAVLDHFAIDQLEYRMDEEEIKKLQEKVTALIADNALLAAAKDAAEARVQELQTRQTESDAKLQAMDARIEQMKVAQDAAPQQIESAVSARLADITARDKLVAQAKPFVGVFDAAAMTQIEAAKYIAGKLDLTVAADGNDAVAAVGAYLKGREPVKAAIAADATPSGGASFIDNYLQPRAA